MQCPLPNAMHLPYDRTAELTSLLEARIKSGGVESQQVYQGNVATSSAFDLESGGLAQRIAAMKTAVDGATRRYGDYSALGMTDAQRDALDASVAEFVRTAAKQLDGLKAQSNSPHPLGAALILAERLAALGAAADQLRAKRVRRALAEAQGGIRADRAAAAALRAERSAAESNAGVSASFDTGSGTSAGAGAQEQMQGKREQEADQMLVQMFERENDALVQDLVHTRERVRRTERSVAEIAQLNHAFAAQVADQAREIERMYELAVDAAHHLDYGNKELHAMRGKRNRTQYALAALLFVLAFVMLALDRLYAKASVLG